MVLLCLEHAEYNKRVKIKNNQVYISIKHNLNTSVLI